MKQGEPAAANPSKRAPGVVVINPPDHQDRTCRHERETHAQIARRLAALKGFAFAGPYEPGRRYPGPVYFVPSATLDGVEAAALGIRGEHDLFGGVVPHAFAATKVISHPLIDPHAQAPDGWSHGFGHRVRDAVLRGFSVFAPEDARRAGGCLLARGPVRVKPARATGGRGQLVAADPAGLEAALAAVDAAELVSCGLVLEEHLVEVTTRSVGQVRVAGLVASYHGTQRLTPDNGGALVYGGSDLVLARGGFEALLGLELTPAARLAVAQARAYDAAATEEFTGFFASRRNYDVAQGRDARGRCRSGVLEQSWRIGGASGAEIAALEAFRASPELHAARASTVEVYGEGATPPPGATVHFRGTDEQVGPITKYALVEPDADPR
jgi:hypothetical protein